jgi:hypothetical protein
MSRAAPLLLAAAFAFAGCAEVAPPERVISTVPSSWPDANGAAAPQARPREGGDVYPPSPPHPFSFVPQAEAAPAPALRPADPPVLNPVDPSCGWWRLCNLWAGS